MLWFLFFDTEGKILVLLSTEWCWDVVFSTWLSKIWSIFKYLLVVDPILLSQIWAISVFGDWRRVEVGSEVLLLLFLEIEHFIGVLLTYVVCTGILMTIFVFLILLSKLVGCCVLLCDNCDVREGRDIGNLLDDKWLFIGIFRLLLLVVSVVFIWIRDKCFLRKALHFLLDCFNSETKFLFILSIFVSNCWSVGF